MWTCSMGYCRSEAMCGPLFYWHLHWIAYARYYPFSPNEMDLSIPTDRSAPFRCSSVRFRFESVASRLGLSKSLTNVANTFEMDFTSR